MLSRTLPIALCLAVPRAQEDGVELRLAAFDHRGIEAGCVLSAPRRLEPERKYPLLLDLHGAADPSRRGARITRERLWSAFAAEQPWIIAGLHGRSRSWGSVPGEHDDRAYARAALELVRSRMPIDTERIYLAGFSSGADFLCSGGLQLESGCAGSLVICPGPPSVVGLRGGELARVAAHAFYFVSGEEDYIRKDGAWQAFLALDAKGSRVMYREVPRLAHAHPAPSEVAVLLRYLEHLAGGAPLGDRAIAAEAHARADWLLASTHWKRAGDAESLRELAVLEARGRALLSEARAIDAQAEPGRAFEAWWHVRTQFHRFEGLAAEAQRGLDAFAAMSGRDLLRARGAWFRQRTATAAAPAQEPPPAAPAPRISPAAEPPPTAVPPALPPPAWSFDHYWSFDEVTAGLADLARRFPQRARLASLGRSIEGREIWMLEVTDRTSGEAAAKPGVYVQGGIHGNEISSTTAVMYLAWQLAANPSRKRSLEKRIAQTAFYLAPAVSPDAVQRYLAEPHSHWRPRFNYRPFDADDDGRIDENPYQDLDQDGEIAQMYRPDPNGAFVLRDGHVVRGEGAARYTPIGREGLDTDGDGRFSEDPPGGVNLNRNFPVGFSSRRDFEGTTGAGPASEPETQAIVAFVRAHENLALFVDVHNDARCLFYWLGDESGGDRALYEALAARAEQQLGYPPRPLVHAGAGLSIAFAYGERGIPAVLVELESAREDKAAYQREKWGSEAFLPARPFEHPQLGAILLGNDEKKIPARNLHPSDILWQAEKNLLWLAGEAELLARIALKEPRVETSEHGFLVRGEIWNTGSWPTDTAMAARRQLARGVELAVEGAELVGERSLGTLAPLEHRPFRIELRNPGEAVTLIARHPRAGEVRYAVRTPRRESTAIRREYAIEPGYATVETARRAQNEFHENGVAAEERGPAFPLAHAKSSLSVAVLLGEWPDQRHAIEASAFERALFSERGFIDVSPTGQRVYGSVRDFYAEMSYGALEVKGKVFDWLELRGNYTSYREASFGSPIVQEELIAALLAREGPHALDGYDGLVFVWAGNAIARTSALWPMRLALRDRPGVVAFKMGELHEGEMAPIGVACHELGHTFGVNDKYGLGSGTSPLGPCCLMAKGTHGGAPSGRHRPFHLCAWCKQVIGWVRPVVLDPRVPQKLALRPITSGANECYRILLQPDGSEYLLLENRRREGFLSDFPSPGLIVLRVGPNDKPSAPQVRVQLVPAHGLPPAQRDVVAEPEHIAWPQPGRTELVVGEVRLSSLRLVDDVIYFELSSS